MTYEQAVEADRKWKEKIAKEGIPAPRPIKHNASEPYKKLYLYIDCDCEAGEGKGQLAWSLNPEHFRKLTGSKSKTVLRVGYDVNDPRIPSGYVATGTGLACDPIERKDNRSANRRLYEGLKKAGW